MNGVFVEEIAPFGAEDRNRYYEAVVSSTVDYHRGGGGEHEFEEQQVLPFMMNN